MHARLFPLGPQVSSAPAGRGGRPNRLSMRRTKKAPRLMTSPTCISPPYQRTQLRLRANSTVYGAPRKQLPILCELGRRIGQSYCFNLSSQHFKSRATGKPFPAPTEGAHRRVAHRGADHGRIPISATPAKHHSPPMEHCGSTETASSTYIQVKNGLVAPPPSPGGTRYSRGKGMGGSMSAGGLTCEQPVAARPNGETTAL